MAATQKFNNVCGIDEAGRGPLAGPVVAAAVIVTRNPSSEIRIDDSKKMTARQREIAYDWICENCAVGIGQCGVTEIDELNILNAAMLAMKRAFNDLGCAASALVDGNRMPPDVPGRCIIGGDACEKSIAAASIVAKVTRDRIMTELAAAHPEYGWDKNAGYGTAAHLTAIRKFGITKHHRKTFGPVKDMI